MTKLELRVLQLLSRQGGQCLHRFLTPHLSRFEPAERDRTIAQLQALGLVAVIERKAARGGRKGGGGLLYSLTPAGEHYVAEARASGKIRDRAERGA